MRWENLTVPEFVRGVADSEGVAIIPIGVLEPHGVHLPLGQDVFVPHWTACEAAKKEPAIVYPPYEWGINHDAAHLAGAIVIRRELATALLENLCDEIGRNGLDKIVLLNGHGGNTNFLRYFVQTITERERPYQLYYANIAHWPDYEAVAEDHEQGHACEMETSSALHIFPELVDMEALPDEPFRRLEQHRDLDAVGAMHALNWYANYPTMYVGDARKATAEKGRHVMERHVDDLVALLRAVKADTITPKLMTEFMAGRIRPRSTAGTYPPDITH